MFQNPVESVRRFKNVLVYSTFKNILEGPKMQSNLPVVRKCFKRCTMLKNVLQCSRTFVNVLENFKNLLNLQTGARIPFNVPKCDSIFQRVRENSRIL